MGDGQLIGRVEGLLEELETLGDPATRDVGLETVQAVLELYGAGLERIVGRLGAPQVTALATDELVEHLLLLHGLHPVGVEERVRDALEGVRPYLGSHGGDVELVCVSDGVARVRMQGSCEGCPASSMTLKLAIEDAVLKAAPDVERVEAEEAAAPATAGGSPLLQIEVVKPAAPAGAWAPAGALPQLSGGGPLLKEVAGEPVLFLRGRFGTRVQVIVSDEGLGLDGKEPETALEAEERALETGREDDSPRRDGALVFVDLASRRAWFRFGPGAPKLTLPDGRPFPGEWHGPDLQASSKGKGIVLRLKALMDAYVRAYAALGITGPPELSHARPPLPRRNIRVAVAPPPDLSLKNVWTPWTNPSFAALEPTPQGGPCALVPLPEAASLLGLPLELDAKPLHGSRDGDPLTCGYSGRGTRSPKRPRYEVELQVAERLPEPERWQPIPGEPEGRRWRVEKNDRGVSVAATTAHGLSVVARVARRDVSGVSGRTELELLTAYHFARLLSMRAQELTPGEL